MTRLSSPCAVWPLFAFALRCDRPAKTELAAQPSARPPVHDAAIVDAPTPTAPTAGPAPACASDGDCGMNDDGRACMVGGERPFPRDRERGLFCACRAARCELVVAGPFPCASWKDCSWTDVPHLRPVPASEVKRPIARPVRPCRDGEVDSVCADSDAGTKVCRIVAWKC